MYVNARVSRLIFLLALVVGIGSVGGYILGHWVAQDRTLLVSPVERKLQADSIISSINARIAEVVKQPKMTAQDSARVGQWQIQAVYWSGVRDAYDNIDEAKVRMKK